MFNSYVGLLSGLEDARNLLLIGAGCRGIAPLRAAIEWTPVQAHSTAHRVTLFYFAPSAQSAAYLKDWFALFPLLLAYIVILSRLQFAAFRPATWKSLQACFPWLLPSVASMLCLKYEHQSLSCT